MQPVQLSLLPEQVRAPGRSLLGPCREHTGAGGVARVGAVFAWAQTAASVTAQVAGDE